MIPSVREAPWLVLGSLNSICVMLVTQFQCKHKTDAPFRSVIVTPPPDAGAR